MRDDLRLGRIAGVAVGASWSLLVILALITWTLGSEVLPAAAPDTHPAAYWTVAGVTAVAFLACLLAHELAHSVVGRGLGIEVAGITLWMFGGVSRLKGEAPDARTEQRMALPARSRAWRSVRGSSHSPCSWPWPARLTWSWQQAAGSV